MKRLKTGKTFRKNNLQHPIKLNSVSIGTLRSNLFALYESYFCLDSTVLVHLKLMERLKFGIGINGKLEEFLTV